MKSLAIIIAWVLAVAFAGATVLGFIPNPLVGEHGIFVANTWHSLVHLATAVGFAIVALMGEKASIRFMQGFGAVYVFVAVLGLVTLGTEPEGYLLNSVRINTADNFLHLGLGIVIFTAGWAAQHYRRYPVVARQSS